MPAAEESVVKAFVFTEKGKIEKQDVPDARLHPDMDEDRRAAILKPRFISPCSSDVHTVYAGEGPRRAGLVLGHEGLAEVAEVGPEVRDFKPGDLVAVSAIMPEPGDITGHEGGHFSGSKLGRNINGMWSEWFYVTDADYNLAHIPDGVSTKAALMAVDMMATGYTAAEEADIREGHTVVVIGSGAVGLMAAAAAKAQTGATGRVIVIGSDKDPVNAELAREFGTDLYLSYRDGHVVFDNTVTSGCRNADTLSSLNGAADAGIDASGAAAFSALALDARGNSTESAAVDAVLACTNGEGAERVLICGGGHEALAQACDMVKYGTGVVVNVSYVEGTGSIGLPIFSLGRGMSGKTFKFELSHGGRAWLEKMLEEARRCDSLQGRLVTHVMHGFDSIPAALAMMHERPAGMVKIMVEL